MLTTEFIDLPPMTQASGVVTLPGSKSISNRVLLLAGLCEGSTLVHDLLDSDDTQVMLDALRILGCKLQSEGQGALRITGIAGCPTTRSAQLFLGNAGTAMRPLTAVLALLSASQGGLYELSGVPRMHERPIGDLIDALRPLGCIIECTGSEGFPPLRLAGGRIDIQGPIRVRGDVSSQFLTALLMALPLVAQHRAIDIEVEGELISKPYIDITLRLLARFGIAIERRQGWQRFVIPAGSRYISPGRIHIEGDASSASYFIGLGAIAAPDSAKPIRIEGLGLDSIQGDIRFIDAASAMGAKIDAGPNWLEIHRGAWPLRAIDLDCNAIPDAAMTLATMALYAEGVTRLRNIASWRVKETDRIAAMACELRKLGATVQEGEDFIAITPPSVPQWRAATIHTYDDHRIAMCFSLAAFNPLASSVDNAKHPCVPVRILDPKCVGKTFPDYFETLFSVSHAPPSAIPVITVDGPTASGKGTLASALAKRLGYHHLDSGVLYRAAALTAMRADVDPSNGPAIAALACEMPLRFVEQRIWLAAEDVTDVLRSESIGNLASVVSAHPEVRAALHDLQLRFRRLPGLVADGRDMGTMIFPDADLKVFLTASAETRAQRRYLQLLSKAITVNMPDLLADLRARDSRDTQRNAAPLKPSSDAHLLDNSMQSVEESVAQVLAWWQQHCEVQRQRNSAA